VCSFHPLTFLQVRPRLEIVMQQCALPGRPGVGGVLRNDTVKVLSEPLTPCAWPLRSTSLGQSWNWIREELSW